MTTEQFSAAQMRMLLGSAREAVRLRGHLDAVNMMMNRLSKALGLVPVSNAAPGSRPDAPEDAWLWIGLQTIFGLQRPHEAVMPEDVEPIIRVFEAALQEDGRTLVETGAMPEPSQPMPEVLRVLFEVVVQLRRHAAKATANAQRLLREGASDEDARTAVQAAIRMGMLGRVCERLNITEEDLRAMQPHLFEGQPGG